MIVSAPYTSSRIQELVGMVKTLQHGGHLSSKEDKLFNEFVETESEWFSRLVNECGGNEEKAHEVAAQSSWLSPLEYFSGGSDMEQPEIRIALRSMRRGKPTFIDQEIARRLVDHLLVLYQTALLEEEVIGAYRG